jgi:hypothetical protein
MNFVKIFSSGPWIIKLIIKGAIHTKKTVDRLSYRFHYQTENHIAINEITIGQ